METSADIIVYETEDERDTVQLRAVNATVWLSKRQISQLFGVSQDNVSLHLKNIYEDREMSREATTEESSVVQIEGGREVSRPLTLYNLDAILAVGYRVRSPRGVQFRRWATTILREYLVKGFAMDDERLKNPDGRPDHFDEMLEPIRDIRASEKRFYQKVRDLFALSTDYDKTDRETHKFFAIVQNLQRLPLARKRWCHQPRAHGRTHHGTLPGIRPAAKNPGSPRCRRGGRSRTQIPRIETQAPPQELISQSRSSVGVVLAKS